MALTDAFNVANLFKAFGDAKDANSERSQPIRVSVGVDPQTPPEVVEAIKGALVPETPAGIVVVNRLEPGSVPSADPGCDISLVLCGGSMTLCHDAGTAWLKVGVPTLMIGRSAAEAPACTFGGLVAQRVCSCDADDLLDRVGHWIIDSTEHDVAFAANFPFCRRAVADGLIRAVALSNAAVCAFGFLPGIVDFTMVTANELKLALDIASVYDQKMTIERLPEVAGVLLFGLGVRGAAALIERFVPRLKWLVNGGAGYAGALATGNALVAHFEGKGIWGEGLGGIVDAAKGAADQISERVGALTGDVVKVGPDATYSQPKRSIQERLSALRERSGLTETEPAPDPGYVEFGADGALEAGA